MLGLRAWGDDFKRKRETMDSPTFSGFFRQNFSNIQVLKIANLQHSEIKKHFQQHKWRIVLMGGNVKDDSGDRAVFTQQGASSSQMAAARFLDTMSRLLCIADQGNVGVVGFKIDCLQLLIRYDG